MESADKFRQHIVELVMLESEIDDEEGISDGCSDEKGYQNLPHLRKFAIARTSRHDLEDMDDDRGQSNERGSN